jgi:hypothetical protein
MPCADLLPLAQRHYLLDRRLVGGLGSKEGDDR